MSWDAGNDACGFTYSWRITDNVLGSFVNLEYYDLCVTESSIDYYALDGVDVLSPNQGKHDDCGEFEDMESCDGCVHFLSLTSCDGDLIRHSFGFSLDNYTSELGLPEGSKARDIELLFSYTNLLGIYRIADNHFFCDEPNNTYVYCWLRFSFWSDERDVSVESKNSTTGVRSSIVEEIVNLAADQNIMPTSLSAAFMEAEICDAVAPDEMRISCSIRCDVSYPYPSSTCAGKYVLELVGSVRYWGGIIVVMLAVTVLSWVLMSTLRLGVLTANGRTARGYLGAGGSCRYFFEEDSGQEGDRLSLANPLPPIRAVRVSADSDKLSVTPVSFSGSGCRDEGVSETPAGLGNIPRGLVRSDDKAPACLGIVVHGNVGEIPREVFSSTTGTSVGCGMNTGSGVLPICFIVRENSDGSVSNLDVEETHRLLNGAGGRALLDESFGGDHLAWARGFSVVDAVGCVMTLWTVHFVAANSGWGSFYWVAALVAFARWLEESDVRSFASVLFFGVRMTPKNRRSSAPPLPLTLAALEVLYDLSIPDIEVIGLIVTVMWTVIILGWCGYVIFLLGYEPVYYGGGCFCSKVSLSTALLVGGALNAPFSLAGNWVRGSRGGDLGGRRLAVSFCVGRGNADSDSARVSRVQSIEHLSPTLETGVLCG